MIEKIFPATDESLAEASGFVLSFLEENDCSPKAMIQIEVAFEELYVNVAHYAYGDKTGDIKITVEVNGDFTDISFVDTGKPFDPLAKPDPDITASADERQIGGLGIFMVKKTMDDVRYKYEDGQNMLTITKKIK